MKVKKQVPNLLTFLRIILTPVFIVLLFYEHPFAKFWALVVFGIASITDAYDGYVARKYDLVTEYGRFLDPLADKILVSSAFISFAVMGIIEYWMVALIVFRDLFVTGLRMVMSRKGEIMITSETAKIKTSVQIVLIIFVLTFLGIKVFSYQPIGDLLNLVREYKVIYFSALAVTFFTLITGFTYVYTNRAAIRRLLN